MVLSNKDKTHLRQLIKDVIFISLLAILFFVIIGFFGGYISDYLTKVSCRSENEKYVPGKKPGNGVCVKIK